MRRVAPSTVRRLQRLSDPLDAFIDFQSEALSLSQLYMTGVGRLRGAHGLAKALDNLARVRGEERTVDLDREKGLSELAHSESTNGFRLLNAHLLIGVWGVFESALEDFVLHWVVARPQDLQWREGDEVKLPAGAVFAPRLKDRADLFLSAVRKRRGTPLAQGINRFEDSLALVGLDGPLPDGLAATVYEMQQLRNLYAHCGGKADRAFVDACRYIPCAEGDLVPITPAVAYRYYTALVVYTTLVMYRAWARLGVVSSAEGYFWKRDLTMADALALLTVSPSLETPLSLYFASPESDPA